MHWADNVAKNLHINGGNTTQRNYRPPKRDYGFITGNVHGIIAIMITAKRKIVPLQEPYRHEIFPEGSACKGH